MYINSSSLTQFHQGLELNDSSLELFLNQHLDRYDKLEPHIHAFVSEEKRTDRIMSEVALLRQTYHELPKPSLYGVPVGVKDLIHIDGLPTRAGSNLPPQELTRSEGSFIKKLRQKGVWFTGKTVTEEFAYAGHLPTRNPHHLDHTPGGSSAGSAAAVATGMCPFAIGTQSLRSVMAPASFCGVVGFKPSYGRIPLDGVQLMSPSFDTMGFFTQDMVSMERVSSELISEWSPFESNRKPVLGIPEGVFMTLLEEDAKHTFWSQIKKLEEAGFVIKNVKMPWEDSFIYGDGMLRLVQGEMAQVHAVRFEKYKDCYGTAMRDGIESGQTIRDEELELYRRGQIKLRYDLLDVQKTEGIDIWVSPAQAGTAPLWGTRTGWAGMTAIWSYAGAPTVSIPSATIHNMPLGFQCIGAYGQDEKLIYWSRLVSLALG
ncbi:amidase [Paenibacillus sp. B-A-8]|uniref:amidase n=1 Tax=Paenibacillus sp. B-A-8 TaxID=3400419 RepID=UPI003B02A480